MFRNPALWRKVPVIVTCSLLLAITASCRDKQLPPTTPAAESKDEFPPSPPVPAYPQSVGASLPYEDSTGSFDENLGLRTFMLPLANGQSLHLTAAYLSQMQDRHDPSDRTFALADLNAGFTSIYAVETAAGTHWRKALVQVGEFSQDYCGDIEIVHYLESAKVSAISFGDRVLTDEILSEAHCPVKQDYIQDEHTPIAPGTDPFGDFCKARSECLVKYLSQPEKADKLRKSLPQALLDVHLD
ncbi:hypothetical protein ACFONG_12470 [Uliginosibacterium paludis]|uniref:Lipoprotein n=1 Tax=Uliginosibacterium paludis TaxID=1615952 RepID=A0ABV2CQQ2_9RHOO